MKKLALIIAGSFLLIFSSCVKQNFETPPISVLPTGTIYTIAQLKQMRADSGSFTYPDSASVFGVITMDETSGNIYKSAYMQDATGAVNLRLTQSGGLRVGDSIRVYLKGIYLSEYGGMFQLDSVQNDSNIVILATQKYIQPITATISDLDAGLYQGMLVKLDSVQFVSSELGYSYADADATTNRTLENSDGKTLIVRTSNYASFASTLLPQGNGSIVGIAGVFNTPQLYIRSLSEVDMTGGRYFIENFTTTLGSFNTFSDAGAQVWKWGIYDNGCAVMSGYSGSNYANTDWLVSPAIDLTNNTGTVLVVNQAAKYVYDQWQNIKILISSDYDGTSSPSVSGTWTELTAPNMPSGNDFNFVNSGDIDISAYDGQSHVYIAFKYVSTTSNACTWEIGRVVVK
ncbi:MAG: choice-of-anchor J domain-containing protein [Bacteroidales bacterium]|nr:choice-of-anchor J domain-containing protein [Bacteroidales bacterium]